MTAALLDVAGLTVRAGEVPLVQDIDLSVSTSGATVLLGRNGAGKTTTVRALIGLRPWRGRIDGTVHFGGTRIDRLPTHAIIQMGIGYVPEDRAVFAGLTVAENLRLAELPRTTPQYDRVFELFPELARRRRQMAGTLSGGQQQMLAIGRVLLGDARLLLIDEPTKGLAPTLVTEVADVLTRLAGQVPILLVEQNLTVVRQVAVHAAVLTHGRVSWTGPASELLTESTLTRTLLGVA
jgi:branched-chain amino acid transport system ATP-binding protein